MSNLQDKSLGSFSFHVSVGVLTLTWILIAKRLHHLAFVVFFLSLLRSAVQKRCLILLPSICSGSRSRPGVAACCQCWGEVGRSASHCAFDYSMATQRLPFACTRSDVCHLIGSFVVLTLLLHDGCHQQTITGSAMLLRRVLCSLITDKSCWWLVIDFGSFFVSNFFSWLYRCILGKQQVYSFSTATHGTRVEMKACDHNPFVFFTRFSCWGLSQLSSVVARLYSILDKPSVCWRATQKNKQPFAVSPTATLECPRLVHVIGQGKEGRKPGKNITDLTQQWPHDLQWYRINDKTKLWIVIYDNILNMLHVLYSCCVDLMTGLSHWESAWAI